MRFTSLALLSASASAWISTSQARFGLSIEAIYNETSLGKSEGEPTTSLGYLWSLPHASRDPLGLGGSITWQWDERLCDVLTFKESFWNIPFGSCSATKASLNRALDTWASNSRHIKFTDVSMQCAEEGYARARCPHAEIWVTSMEALRDDGLATTTADRQKVADALAQGLPTLSVAVPQYSPRPGSDFQYTNGLRAMRNIGSDANPAWVRRTVTEVTGGTLAFRTSDTCWYLDTAFCRSFHGWKKFWGQPEAAQGVGVALLFALWGLAVLAMFATTTIDCLWACRRNAAKAKARKADELPPPATRLGRLKQVVHGFSVLGTALRVLLLIVIWPYYNAMFVNCWDCYDFEAGAAHEMGHLLGLGHPELAPRETIGGYSPAGDNSYHVGLSQGVPFDNVTCLTPWDGVRPGVPPEFGDVLGAGGVMTSRTRPSIMYDFNKHNPRVCLEDDDLEAINVLYPDCMGAPTVPVCAKPPLNLGWLRSLLVSVAFILCWLFAALLKWGTSPEAPQQVRRFKSYCWSLVAWAFEVPEESLKAGAVMDR